MASTVQYGAEKNPDSRLRKLLGWAGNHSMELYTVHPFYLSIISAASAPLFSLNGMGLCTVNLILMLALTLLTARVLSANRLSRLLLFGKR